MKTTIVPAQVTTVEDRVTGNLSFTQLLLLVTPVFIDGAIFVLLPPLFGFNLPKMIISIVIAAFCATLAIRLKGKILLSWIVIMLRYKLRPQYYLFNKNDPSLRTQPALIEPEDDEVAIEIEEKQPATTLIPTPDLVRLEQAVDDPRANFHIELGKGGIRVHIREVKEESI